MSPPPRPGSRRARSTGCPAGSTRCASAMATRSPSTIRADGAAAARRTPSPPWSRRYGMLVSHDAPPITAGHPANGTLRVVVSRAVAHVEGCPDWSRGNAGEYAGATKSNFGCADASNLAAMIANPQDLIEGRCGRYRQRRAAERQGDQDLSRRRRRPAPVRLKAESSKSAEATNERSLPSPFRRPRAIRSRPSSATTRPATCCVRSRSRWAGRRRRSTRAVCATRCRRSPVSASPMILFVDMSESGDPLNDINALAEVCEPGTVVIACGPGQRRAPLSRSVDQRHPGLSAQAVQRGPGARGPRPRPVHACPARARPSRSPIVRI